MGEGMAAEGRRTVATFKKHFRVEEANAMSPHSLAVFEPVQSIRDELDKSKEELEAAQRSANDNGGFWGREEVCIWWK